MSLFAEQERQALEAVRPLAARMRPRTLDEFVGQRHLLAPDKLLRQLIEQDRLGSAVLYGPPGCGKTTLAHIIADRTSAAFERLHAAEAGVKDVRRVGENARRRLTAEGRRTVLFLDEIHRFNRTQQDNLLSDVEDGVLTLLGATTENPYAALNTPLISRSRVFEFHRLTPEHLRELVTRALQDADRGLGTLSATLAPEAADSLIELADGDARRVLATLEAAAQRAAMRESPVLISREDISEALQRKVIGYDRAGEMHYDVASALIKSVRGSDPDAALYWLACMLEGGEDPLFIARRIAILASEDIGNADPQALNLAAAALTVTQSVGLPECQFALAQAVTYLACAPKSNAVTRAIGAARQDVRDKPTLPVPIHLRNRKVRSADATYVSPHASEDGVIAQDYLGAERRYYEPTSRGFEAKLAERLASIRRALRAAPSD